MIRRWFYVLLCKIDRMKQNALWEIGKEGLLSLGDNCHIEPPFDLRGKEKIIIGNNFHCCRGCRIQAIVEYAGCNYYPRITIGDNVSINCNADIACINEIKIDSGVQIANNVLITDHYHGKIDGEAIVDSPSMRELYSKGPVHICENVWIGYGVAIMPGVVIGKNSIIGANSVVTSTIPENVVAVGVPARVVREL